MRIGKYTSIFATSEHLTIVRLTDLTRHDYPTMGFFLKGKCLGYGTLIRFKKSDVNTTSVSLRPASRRKGHGVPLYVHLVMTAKALGARRIFSDKRLNKFSRRMWKEKLAAIFPVETHVEKRVCSRCDHTNPCERYSIDLSKVRLSQVRGIV